MQASEQLLQDTINMDEEKVAAKSATYRQYFGNRMLYKMMLEKYKEYGLIE